MILEIVSENVFGMSFLNNVGRAGRLYSATRQHGDRCCAAVDTLREYLGIVPFIFAS
jgi:hypothetical protein